MIEFIRKHLQHILLGHTLALSFFLIAGVLTIALHGNLTALLASATSSLNSSSALLYFTPYDDGPITIGDTADIDININARVPVNAIGATIKFPEDTLEVVGISKKKSFLDLWTEETVIKENIGEVHFSGGTTIPGGLMGTGTVLTISVRAKKDGDAKLYIKDLQVLAPDGKGSTLSSDIRPITYTIKPRTSLPSTTNIPASSGNIVEQPRAPSADLNDDGTVDLVDMSILVIKIISPYDPRYDLDMNGTVGLSDLSILFSRMKGR